jgi:hypothetical protein
MGREKPLSTLGKSAKHYRSNPKSLAKKYAYAKKYNAKPRELAKRRELEKIRVKDKKKGADTSNNDYDHAVGKRIPYKTNRGRKEKSRLKGYNSKV